MPLNEAAISELVKTTPYFLPLEDSPVLGTWGEGSHSGMEVVESPLMFFRVPRHFLCFSPL